MNRVMIWATALLLMVAGMAVSQEANAGLFSRKNDCCKPQKCKQQRCKKQRCKKQRCEQDSCCAPEPTCCEAPVAPCCSAPVIEATPACGCSAPVVEAAPACGCSAAVAAPACGCQVANCDCLSKRQLRRANRKGECCDAQVNTCSSCSTCGSAPVQTASYEVSAPIVEGCSTCGSSVQASSYEVSAPAVEGCSTCGGGEVIIESAPTPAAASEEAAPEAPESDSTT